MSATWATVLGLAIVTFAIKAAGPVVLGGRDLPPWTLSLIGLVAPALLGALVMVETFGKGKDLVLDARAAGVLVAGALLAARLSVLWAVAGAAAAAALVRAIT